MIYIILAIYLFIGIVLAAIVMSHMYDTGWGTDPYALVAVGFVVTILYPFILIFILIKLVQTWKK